MKDKLTAIKILQLAKNELWNGDGAIGMKTWYVCYAVSRVATADRTLYDTADDLIAWINVQLGEHATATSWLESKGIDVDSAPARAVQRWRHLWVNHMIAELKEAK